MTNRDRPGLTHHQYLVKLEQLKQRGRATHVNQAEQFIEYLENFDEPEVNKTSEKATAQLKQASIDLENLLLDF